MIPFLLRHKLKVEVLLVVVIVLGVWGYKKLTSTVGETRYVLATASKGTLVTSVSGSGQVDASQDVEVKAKVSGDVLLVGVTKGQDVKAGALLVALDARDAQKSVRDAEANLANAKLGLAKLQQPADTLSILQAENALVAAKESKKKADDDLVKVYDDALNAVSNAFLDLPTIMTGLQDILLGTTLSGTTARQSNASYYADSVKDYDAAVLTYKDDALASYEKARMAYEANLTSYKASSRSSSNTIIESLLGQTYETTKVVAEAVKSSTTLVQFYKDKLTEHLFKPNALADTHLASLASYTSKTNSHVAALLGMQRTIQTDKDAVESVMRSTAEKTASLQKLKDGADTLDIQSQELTIQSRANALLDAREKLADYSIRAPFAGVVATFDLKRGDSVSANAIVAKLITKQRKAVISLNEVDVARVTADEKATLTFDAVPDLTITGVVTDIDALGTVTQGVVSYSVKITFDTQDERVKPGMSVSAAIITNVKQDILLVPNGAVKTQGEQHVVSVFDAPPSGMQGSQGVASAVPPRQQTITVGLSNDTVTEILSGLREGDTVVARTIVPTVTTTPQQAPSVFGNAGGRGGTGGGGALRLGR